MKLFSIILSIMLLIICSVRGQHVPLLNNYFADGIFYNPAKTGAKDHLIAGLTYQKRMDGMPGAPEVNTLTMHSPFAQGRIGLGLVYLNESIGDFTENVLMLNYAYKLRLRSGELSMGLAGGIDSQRNILSADAALDIDDSRLLNYNSRITKGNASAGLEFRGKKWTFSASTPLVLSRNVALSFAQASNPITLGTINLIVMSTYRTELSKKHELEYLAMTRRLMGNQAHSFQVDGGLRYIFDDRISIGMIARSSGALLLQAECRIKDQWRFNYTNEQTFFLPTNPYGGGNTIGIQYELVYRYKASPIIKKE